LKIILQKIEEKEKNMEIKRIGVLTGGGDCPGLNPVIRAVVKTAICKYGMSVVGFKNGYKGLYNNECMELTLENTSGILRRGGTILYSSNKDNLFDYLVEDENGNMVKKNVSHVGVENIKKNNIDALIIIGGDGTLTSGRDFGRLGVPVIGVPKTIDNDLSSTDVTFGYDTAISVATECIDRLHTTAESHHRIITVEIMGRYAGFLALSSGIAGGAHSILIPEIPYNINIVADFVKSRIKNGKEFSVVVVSEGAKSTTGEVSVLKIIENSPDPIRLGGAAQKVADDLEELVGLEARATVLGHIQRGGVPTAADRILSTRYGVAAVELAIEGKFGHMVALIENKMTSVSLEEVIGKNKGVDPDGELVTIAKSVGICFGD
jgi:6-phosphofructokinase 1